MRKLLYALTVTALVTVGLYAQQGGGAFVPGFDYTIPGNWTFTGTTVFPAGSGATAPVTVGGTQTLTSKTLTSPTLTTPVLSGSITGTYTLAGTPTLTAPTINTATMSGAINSDYKVLAANATYTSTITPATLTGFSWTVVPGSYIFEVNLPATLTTSGGLNVNFLLTTAVLTSIQYQTYAATAADNGTAVSTQGTTTTSGTLVFSSKTAAYTLVTVKGSMVVGTGGTFAWQGSQETSAGGGDASIVKLGSFAKLSRVS
jgi:hypothetical protein